MPKELTVGHLKPTSSIAAASSAGHRIVAGAIENSAGATEVRIDEPIRRHPGHS